MESSTASKTEIEHKDKDSKQTEEEVKGDQSTEKTLENDSASNPQPIEAPIDQPIVESEKKSDEMNEIHNE
jgi:hypothetical protein